MQAEKIFDKRWKSYYDAAIAAGVSKENAEAFATRQVATLWMVAREAKRIRERYAPAEDMDI